MIDLQFIQRPRHLDRLIERRLNRSQIGRQHDGFAPPFTAPRVEDVEQDSKQPRPRIRPLLELVKAAPRQQQTLLYQILRLERIERQPARDTKQASRVAHGNAFEFVLTRGHNRQVRGRSICPPANGLALFQLIQRGQDVRAMAADIGVHVGINLPDHAIRIDDKRMPGRDHIVTELLG